MTERTKRVISVFLCALIACAALACPVYAEESEDGEASARVALMNVGGLDLYLDDVQNIAYQMYYYGYTQQLDYQNAARYCLYYDIAPRLLAGDRAQELLGTSYDTLRETFEKQYDDYIEQYALSLAGTDADEAALNEARAQAQAEYDEAGISREYFLYGSLASSAFDVLVSTSISVPTDEEILALYEQYVEEDRKVFENDVQFYEYYKSYGYESLYTPEGYRAVLHILLPADDELLSAYNDAADDEQRESARLAVIESIRDTLDEIYAAYEAGTSFIDLIAQYNVDPGMQDETNLRDGYEVHKDSVTWVDEFTKGAFSEGMNEPGDVSEPVVTSYGVHILYYLRDIASGAAELTEQLRQDLISDLTSKARTEFIEGELSKYEIVYYDAYAEYLGDTHVIGD
ncbi:MAG: peptidylprolyl isomerase [Clostridia bacterium]|nr:peptidylprolyl isomerase [Clostridia bacterium]